MSETIQMNNTALLLPRVGEVGRGLKRHESLDPRQRYTIYKALFLPGRYSRCDPAEQKSTGLLPYHPWQ